MKVNSKYEIEFRSLLTEEKYNHLMVLLCTCAEDLGIDDKDSTYFILPEKLLKVVNNVSKGNAKLSLKYTKIGHGNSFKESEIMIAPSDYSRLVEIIKDLELTNNIMYSFQKRHNFRHKGIDIALKHSETWGFHVEFETLIENPDNQDIAEKAIRKIANELDVKLMTNEELLDFTTKKEAESRAFSNNQ